jgi:large subunit ribosomal protein L3
MAVSLIGIKSGMTCVYNENGVSTPVTVVHVEPNTVIQVKDIQEDGYRAVKVSVGTQKIKRLSKSVVGMYQFDKENNAEARTSIPVGRTLKEIRLSEADLPDVKCGDQILVSDCFTEGQLVDVSGISKGKGFAGVIKRHNFKMQDATHGNSLSHRAPGSIGQCQTPGRVFKGKKMAGQMGNVKRTIQKLKVIRVDSEKSLIFIQGSIPGMNGGLVSIKPSVKAIHES